MRKEFFVLGLIGLFMAGCDSSSSSVSDGGYLNCEADVCTCQNSALYNCSGNCVSFGVDNENCGGCGIKCPDTHQCIAGTCHIKL